MKIKMLTGLSGPEYNLAPGDERDFKDAEAIRLIEAGFAEPVDGEKRVINTKKQAAEKSGKA